MPIGEHFQELWESAHLCLIQRFITFAVLLIRSIFFRYRIWLAQNASVMFSHSPKSCRVLVQDIDLLQQRLSVIKIITLDEPGRQNCQKSFMQLPVYFP